MRRVTLLVALVAPLVLSGCSGPWPWEEGPEPPAYASAGRAVDASGVQVHYARAVGSPHVSFFNLDGSHAVGFHDHDTVYIASIITPGVESVYGVDRIHLPSGQRTMVAHDLPGVPGPDPPPPGGHPDHLAWARQGDGGRSLWVGRLDTTTGEHREWRLDQPVESLGPGGPPVATRDGRWLVYSVKEGVDPTTRTGGRWTLHAIDMDGDDHTLSGPDDDVGTIALDPGGRFVVAAVSHRLQGEQLVRYDIPGSGRTVISGPGDSGFMFPSVSPDGQRVLVYMASQDGQGPHVIRTDGSGGRKLADEPPPELLFLRNDGKYAFYTNDSARTVERHGSYMVSIEGGHVWKTPRSIVEMPHVWLLP